MNLSIDALPMDPMVLDQMASPDLASAFLAAVGSSPSAETRADLADVHALLERIPAREADFIELYYLRGWSQGAIGRLFGLAQPSVLYRLRRAMERLRYWDELINRGLDFTAAEVEAALQKVVTDPIDAEVLLLVWETSSQTAAGKALGIGQSAARYRLHKGLKQLERSNIKGMEPFVELFHFTLANLTIKKEQTRKDNAPGQVAAG